MRRRTLAASARYIFRHMWRSPGWSILTILLAATFMTALGWMDQVIQRNTAEVERLYAVTPVACEIAARNPEDIKAKSGTQNFVEGNTIRKLEDTGVIQDQYLEIRLPLASVAPAVREDGNFYPRESSKQDVLDRGQLPPDYVIPWDEAGRYDCEMYTVAFRDPDRFFQRGMNQSLYGDIQYAQDWDQSLFAEDWSRETVVPIILDSDVLEAAGLHLGDLIYYFDTRYNWDKVQLCRIAGCRRGSLDVPVNLLPLSAMERMVGAPYVCNYSVAEFALDPAFNRELPEVKETLTAIVTAPEAGRVPLKLIVHDQELRQVVESMERSVGLMHVLFPVVAAVAVLLSGGFSGLIVLQETRNAANLRILGISRPWVQGMLCAQPTWGCLVGIFLGLCAVCVLRGGISLAFKDTPQMLCAGLYFWGGLSGAVIASVRVLRKKPLELLQQKE